VRLRPITHLRRNKIPSNRGAPRGIYRHSYATAAARFDQFAARTRRPSPFSLYLHQSPSFGQFNHAWLPLALRGGPRKAERRRRASAGPQIIVRLPPVTHLRRNEIPSKRGAPRGINRHSYATAAARFDQFAARTRRPSPFSLHLHQSPSSGQFNHAWLPLTLRGAPREAERRRRASAGPQMEIASEKTNHTPAFEADWHHVYLRS
jgi:hypothetical protein